MKKVSIIATITLLIMFSMSACALISNESNSDRIEPTFKEIPENYTIEQAKKDGCYVRVNSEAVAGVEEWNKFLQDTSNQKEANIRVMKVDDDETSYTDLYYSDGYYHTFESIAGEVYEQKFKYFLTIFTDSQKTSKMIVLSDDKDLTYDDIMKSYTSSMAVPGKSLFKIIFWEHI